MTSRKRYLTDSRNNSMQHPRPGEVVDMEMDCIICRTRLYVPETSIDSVLTSLEQTGSAILICPGGHMQLVRQRVPQSQYKNA